jgi:hypothetical protein
MFPAFDEEGIMETWVIVCWFLHKPPATKNIWLLPPAAGNIWLLREHRTQQLCLKQVQEMKDTVARVPPGARTSEIKPEEECSCFPVPQDMMKRINEISDELKMRR